MARTPLVSRLQRLFADHRLAQRFNLDIEAIRDMRSESARGDSGPIDRGRRDFMLAGAAAAASVALPRRSFAKNAPRIAIVGAGIAGLNCALALRDRGIHATIYEASGRVGGRMLSNNRGYWDENQVSEWGGELVDTGHVTIRALAERFGLVVDDLIAAQPEGSEDTYKFLGQYYSSAQADQDFSQIFDAVQAEVESAPFPTSFDSFTPAGQALDRLSVYDWIETRVPGGHGSPLGQLLDVAYAAEYGADTTQQAALNLLYLLGFQPDATGQRLEIFGESDEAGHIRGGNEQLPQAIARHLGVEETIRFGMRLERTRRTSHGDYRLTFDRQGRGEGAREVRADIVVLALPFAVLRRLDFDRAGFDDRKVAAIRELGRGRNGKLVLQFTRRAWTGRGAWPGIGTGGSDADTGYQESWDTTRAQAGVSGILTLFQGGSGVNDAFTRRAFGNTRNPLVIADAIRALNQLAPVYPSVPALWNGKATQSLWHKHPLTRCSYSYYRVGQYTRFGGYEKARQDGVFFCGEHTSTEFQGYMEGGAAEGERAAIEVAEAIA
jgi:monoamine oxidase